MEYFSLRDKSKKRIQGFLHDIKQKYPHISTFILILDEYTIQIISSCIQMTELVEYGISALEKLDLKRKSFPTMHAIYFLQPCYDSIEKLQNDFSNKKNPMYGNIHILLTNALSDKLMEIIAKNDNLVSRIKTFTETCHDFASPQKNLFSLNLPQTLKVCYSQRGKPIEVQTTEMISDRLFSLFPCIEKLFEVEILYNKSQNKLPEVVSQQIQSRLNKYIRKLEDTDNEILDKDAGKITLIILDRSIDPISPVIHDFYYESMLYDILNVQNGVIDVVDEVNGKQVTKKVVLQKDDIYESYRYNHIAQVMVGLPQEFQTFVNTNNLAKLQQGNSGNMDLNKMTEMVKNMPQYKDKLARYELHIKLIQQILSHTEEYELREVGELEQTLATGIDQDSKNSNDTQLLKAIAQKLNSSRITQEQKARLLLIAIMTMDLAEKNRIALTENIPIEDQKILLGLQWLGVNVQSSGKKVQKVSDKTRKMAKDKQAKSNLDLCRYTTVVEQIVQKVFDNQKNNLDSIKNMDIVEMAQIKVNEKKKNESNAKSLKKNIIFQRAGNGENDSDLEKKVQKVIVFVIGGVSYLEIRSLRQIHNEEKVVVIGGTTIDTCKQFLANLKQMNSTIDS